MSIVDDFWSCSVAIILKKKKNKVNNNKKQSQIN